jgi:hypothetical protein
MFVEIRDSRHQHGFIVLRRQKRLFHANDSDGGVHPHACNIAHEMLTVARQVKEKE